MPDLTVQIKADLTNYIAGMKQAGSISASAASDITKELAKTSQAQSDLGGSTLSTSMKFQQMRSGMSAARDGLIGFTQSGVRADNALMAMGHHFTTLVSETGSVGGAFTALSQSLLGAGGIILAITLAAELWTKYGKNQKDAADGIKEADKATADFIMTLSTVRQAQLKAQEDGQAELTRLQILYSATQNHTLSLKDRNRAYDELETKYPQFFNNADREKTLLGENAIAYEKLAGSILAAASAKAYENQIGLNANKVFEDQQKVNDSQEKIEALQNNIHKAKNTGQTVGAVDFASQTRDQIALNAETKKRDEAIAEQNKLLADNATLVQMAANSEQAAGFKTETQIDGKTDKIKEQKTQIQLLEDSLKKLQSTEDAWLLNGNKADILNLTPTEHKIVQVTAEIERLKDSLKDASVGNIGKFANNGKNDEGKSVFVGATGLDQQGIQDGIIAKMDAAVASHKKLDDAVSTSQNALKLYNEENAREAKNLRDVENILGNGLVNAMNTAITGGQNFFQSITQELEKLVLKLAETAIAAEALALILQFTPLGGWMDISAGASSFSSIFSGMSGLSIPGHADGGITLKPHLAMVGEGGENEVIAPLSKLKDYMGNSGGNNGAYVMGESRLQGATLITQIVRANKQKARIG